MYKEEQTESRVWIGSKAATSLNDAHDTIIVGE
jgi:hypothetical protein